ncbi:uncharacterized protein LOC127094840 [Lathyrus oleraceus]|uniref:uncharacterized protein LOC127094840 n=1 Tax=Pisum sativum TaxID=3888 RepID=UPI0021CF7063|nr:uncharacterized protein LOC127094840 [Pisum sativum]
MVTIGERVESGLKSGKITYTTAAQTTNKRPHGGFAKKKEGEANILMAKACPRYQFLMAPMSYYPYLYVAAAQYQQPPFQYQPQKGNQQPTPAQKNPNQQYNRDNRGQNRGQNNKGNYGNCSQFDKISVPYAELVPYLIHVGAIVPIELPAASPPYNHSHNPNATCAFHAGYIGHSTKDYHSGAAVNAVIEEETTKSIRRTKEVKPLMSVVLQRLEQFGFLEGVHDDCAVCEFDLDNSDHLKGCVQELMDQGLIQFSKSQAVEEVEAVPWNYETTTYLGGNEIRIPDTEIVNIAGTGGMTRSGHVFASKYTPRVSPAPTVIPPKEKVIENKATKSETSKGKAPMVEKEQVEDYKKSITFEESQEFLKLIKKSDFKIVDQLNQTPSKISILSSRLSSEAHHKALLKVLNVSHVMQDITVDQFDDVVSNITASRYLGFNEAEVPFEGNGHNKELHILVTCTDSLLSRVLVDTGSSLNVLPKSTLSQLQFKGTDMRTIALIIHAFDGSRRQVIWKVDLPICVGPHQFNITFQVGHQPSLQLFVGQTVDSCRWGSQLYIAPEAEILDRGQTGNCVW